MKRAFQILGAVAIFLSSCSAPLDAGSVETEKMKIDGEDNDPIEISVPKGAKEFPGAEPEDMLGMFTVYSKKVRTEENFALEIEFNTTPGTTVAEAISEKGDEIKAESNFSKVIEEKEDGFFYESKEINGQLNYSFIKAIVTPNKYAIVFPEPKSYGVRSIEEAKFMYEIVNKK